MCKGYLYLHYHYVEGDHIKVTASKYSFPTVCKEDQATDWFNSLSKCLHWNKRQRQKSFAIVESNRGVHKSNPTTPTHKQSAMSNHTLTMTSVNSHNHQSNRKSRSSSPPSLQQHKRLSSTDSSPYTTSSSEALPDEVFAMFIEDEYNLESGSEEDALSDSEFFKSSDEEDDTSSTEDGFNGWTDEEIIKARFSSKVTLELERLSMSKST